MNASTQKRFSGWTEKNCLDPEQLSKIDFDAEFGNDLSFHEAVDLALQKFPTMWKSDASSRNNGKPKQIIFVKDLVEKIIAGKVQVTYRKAPKIGTYYVIANRFKQTAEASRVLIEFYQTDKINAYELTDSEAQLAGVDNADTIRELFQKWYGSPIPILYRNWFKIKELGGS
ncbi:MAG: hypothetical protein ACYC7D_08005 [Nitrososphaerales archaeon]